LSFQEYLKTSDHILYLFNDCLKIIAVGKQALISFSIQNSGLLGVV
jgi:hypothetical protein